ncbi:helix-turn-helix transcriptional regulator [Pseudomonas sp.]|uniref:helix-turn-helix transcriptional regulator n=1 Tax=Pseudomonas sp. TaxID=306 RepID=UPI0028A5C35A|nr:helix-turn-helix transcriptional regulator [Pseudomonas sp.]
MTLTLQDVAWHRDVGQLIAALDKPNFWTLLIRLLRRYLPFDSWVVLLFGAGRPQVFAESPGADGGADPLFQDYLKGLYLLDPFYLAARENPASGLFRLADVAPECFEQTDYYQRYFSLNVVADEVQLNVQLDEQRVLCLSLGSHRPFSPEQTALLGLLSPWLGALLAQRRHFEALPRAEAAEPDWQSRLAQQLTQRELDVARLLLSGHSGKEIARKLEISAETVKVHRKHIYSKLGIKSHSELFSLLLKAQDA